MTVKVTPFKRMFKNLIQEIKNMDTVTKSF